MAPRGWQVIAGLMAALTLPGRPAQPSSNTVALTSGGLEYRLRQDHGTLWWEYFGPTNGPSWTRPPTAGAGPEAARFTDLGGTLAGQPFGPEQLRLDRVDHDALEADVHRLRLVFRHEQMPLHFGVTLTGWSDTGVFTRDVTVTNTGTTTLAIDDLPSLSWELPPGPYQLAYLWGGKFHERNLAVERLGPGRREFVSRRGRSSQDYAPWFCLGNETSGVRFAAQLAWSGDWRSSFERVPNDGPWGLEALRVRLGVRFDGGGPLHLAAGASCALPRVAFTATEGDPDDLANRLHQYQNRFVVPRSPDRAAPLLQFNTRHAGTAALSLAELKSLADRAADLGLEVFVVDGGWPSPVVAGQTPVGGQIDPWTLAPTLEDLARHCHERGLRFGLRLDVESVDAGAPWVREHPDWFLDPGGAPARVDRRRRLDYSQAAVRAGVRVRLDELIRRTGLDWLTLDPGVEGAEPPEPVSSRAGGGTHFERVRGYYQWLDDLRSAWPELILENSAAGGLRNDLGLLGRTHTSRISDAVTPWATLRRAFGATFEFTPESCNQWLAAPPAASAAESGGPVVGIDFRFRAAMNGTFSVSSPLTDWSPEAWARARENLALYQRIRPVITGGAATYHLTAPPHPEIPTNWLAIQYVAAAGDRGVLLAYRLGGSLPDRTFGLRGLDPRVRYRIRQDTRVLGILSGEQLMRDGLRVVLPAEWQAAVMELEATEDTPVHRLDGTRLGAVFEGLGGLSAGASSRLLIDYPEPQRSQVLDLLFRPHLGAALQHLKVEIGGDINSTDGTEPSHQRTRDDLNFQRGYEWWLMKEARRRNPAIQLDALQWGAPAWIGGGEFYSRDNADYLVRFLEGARDVHGLDLQYAGVWNETRYDTGWIKLFREVLDARGFQRVQIVAADEVNGWSIARVLRTDPRLARSVAVIGSHYPKYISTPEALAAGKPVWSSEDGPWKGTWEGAVALAKLYNRNYLEGRMTKTIIWSPVTSYYDNLPLPGSGLMRANTPWSGHFEDQPALWATAHTTQFADPGWLYLAGSASGFLPGGGSVVALRSPDTPDYSLVVETVDVTSPQVITVEIAGGLSTAPLQVWRTTRDASFEQLADLHPREGRFVVTFEGGALYSLTTTRRARKGPTTAPPPAPFPLPYAEDFDAYAVGATPRYFSDQAGAFEVARRSAGTGQSLHQVITRKGIEWPYHWNPLPESFLGDLNWRDYSVSVDVRLPGEGYASLFGRVGRVPQSQDPPAAYWLKCSSYGTWELGHGKHALASGDTPFAAGAWHRLGLRFTGDRIEVQVNDRMVGGAVDTNHPAGMVGLGCGWHTAEFDNLRIAPIEAPRAVMPH